MTEPANPQGHAPSSPWAPFRHPAFLILWSATLVSNIGTWMHDVGAGWLMTELSPSPVLVAAVQAATTLRVFLLALPAGALADIVDRRRLLIAVNLALGLVAGCLALLVSWNSVTPAVLLGITFMMGAGTALMAPAWQAIVPQLVPRAELTSAVGLNSMGINISRAIGPALAGFLIVSYGLALPFLLNALSVLGIIAALLWWRPPAPPRSQLPPETIVQAMYSGVRYALYSPPLKATLVRAASFFIFASAFWSLLPLIARNVLGGGPTLYGILLGSLGAGAVLGAVILPHVKSRLGPDRTLTCGTLAIAAVIAVFAVFPNEYAAVPLAALSGISWIAALSTLNVSAQTSLPDWVRARGLSIFLMVFFGAMTAGSLLWGQVATLFGVPAALGIAAVGAVVVMPLTRRAKLNQGADMDLAPSMHWLAPFVSQEPTDERGPVMVQITYEIAENDRETFVALMHKLSEARRRHGVYGWSLMQDASEPKRFVETWFETSWLQHLRHHERVSGSDRDIQKEIEKLHVLPTAPSVVHLISRL